MGNGRCGFQLRDLRLRVLDAARGEALDHGPRVGPGLVERSSAAIYYDGEDDLGLFRGLNECLGHHASHGSLGGVGADQASVRWSDVLQRRLLEPDALLDEAWAVQDELDVGVVVPRGGMCRPLMLELDDLVWVVRANAAHRPQRDVTELV